MSKTSTSNTVGTAKPTPLPAAATSTSGPARPAASFNDVKSLAISGSRTSASDVVVRFSDSEISLQSSNGKTAPAVLSYGAIVKATYSRDRDPKWDPELSGPAEKINVPGILGRARHWLVLQGADRYLILRLDGDDRLELMKAFEERTGIVIDRSTGRSQE